MRTILVDEYQDTNELQYKILSSIVKCNKNIQVTFVGDTDQAIYGDLVELQRPVMNCRKSLE